MGKHNHLRARGNRQGFAELASIKEALQLFDDSALKQRSSRRSDSYIPTAPRPLSSLNLALAIDPRWE